MKTKTVIAVVGGALLVLVAASAQIASVQARRAEAQAQRAEAQARAAAAEAGVTEGTSFLNPLTGKVQALQRDYKQAVDELLDVQLDRELDALRPEAQRHGEVLAQKETAVAERAARLRESIKAALTTETPASHTPSHR